MSKWVCRSCGGDVFTETKVVTTDDVKYDNEGSVIGYGDISEGEYTITCEECGNAGGCIDEIAELTEED